MSAPARARPGSTKVLRIISRLNVGGPAIQAITLTRELERLGYRTTLVRGREDAREGSMDDLAARLGVRPVLVPSLRRATGPHDVAALAALASRSRRERPDIVHTHAAKAGALGRLAALAASPRHPPVLVHTFHGHTLSGYFSGSASRRYRDVERFLGARTTRLVAVSAEVRDDLVALGVAPAERFEVIPLGFDLSPFGAPAPVRVAARERARRQLGLAGAERVVTLVARLVPIKRVDRFLDLALSLSDVPDVRFLVVGDGDLAGELRSSEAARALGDRVVWAGLRRDVADVCFASDVVVLTSDNEGTPVSLIEAQAAGVAVVSTDVGGVRSVVVDGETGRLAAANDVAALADGVRDLLADPAHAAAMGERGRSRAIGAFSLDRLVADVDGLYRRLLAEAAA